MNALLSPPAPRLVRLSRHDLLPALADPALGALSFLNEVIDRYPDAVSFAPGAPFAGFLDDLDVSSHLARYERHLVEDRGLTPALARRRLYQYGPAQGIVNDLLARALALDLGIDVPPQALVVTVGCQEAMVLALRTLCPTPDDVLAVVDPCFVGISGAAKVLGVPVVAVPDSGGVDLAALAAACRAARAQGRRVRALYVAPDFSNPGGALMDLATRQALLTLAAEHDFLLLEDNAYGFTADEDGVPLPTLKALDRDGRVLYLGTCAKICLPGVRIGFVVADQRVAAAPAGGGRESFLAEEMTLLKSMLTVNTSPICQAIVGGMLLANGGSLAAVGREKGRLYRRNLGLLLQALDRHLPPARAQALGVSWNRPTGGFFVRMALPVEADHALLDRCAARHGVLWTPMRDFHLAGGGRRELRLACSYLTPDEIEEGVRRLAGFLSDAELVPRG